MTPVLITPPASEPVSLVAMKAYLRVSGSEEDGVITELIRSARAHVERETRRALISQKWRLYLDDWPFGRIIIVPMSPLIEVEEVAVYDAEGNRHVLPATDYQVDKARAPARIRVRPGAGLSSQELNGIEVDVTLGYGTGETDVPESLRHSVRLLAAHWFEHREEAVDDVVEPIPFGVDRLLSTHRVPQL